MKVCGKELRYSVLPQRAIITWRRIPLHPVVTFAQQVYDAIRCGLTALVASLYSYCRRPSRN